MGLGVALVSSLKLVFAFAVKATQHSQFVRDFTLLEKRLRTDASEETVMAVTQERLDLEALEPPVMQVLDVLCHNDLLRAMGYADESEQVAVTWWQRQNGPLFQSRDAPPRQGRLGTRHARKIPFEVTAFQDDQAQAGSRCAESGVKALLPPILLGVEDHKSPLLVLPPI